MKKYLFSLILTGVLGIYSEVLADAEKETAGIVDDGYVASLRECKPAVYENKIRIIGREVTVRQEIKGIEDGFCRLIIGSDSERKSDCRIPLEKMKVLADSFQNPEPADNDLLNDDKYCQDLPTDKVNSFNDVNGVAYDCDTVLNVQLVSVEECSKCPNRKMVENSKLKFNGKPLNYCVLKQCPAEYRRDGNGGCQPDKVAAQEKVQMQQYFIDNGSKKLIVFFAGWGCDEHQFANLRDHNYDVLMLFDYNGLGLNFDFSKYEEIHVIGYSAGVFVASLVADRLPNLKQKIAVNGNPYLFDAQKGLSPEMINVLNQVLQGGPIDFQRDYLVFSPEEYELSERFPSKRSLESSRLELEKLQEFYQRYRDQINPEFNRAIISDNDKIFNLNEQKNFYGDKLVLLPETRHHVFFKFKSFEDILRYK